MGKKIELTPEKRAEIAARDVRIKRGMRAGDPAATKEGLEIVRRDMARIVRRRGKFLLRAGRWEDACQSVCALALRWREDPILLREEESLWCFTVRLIQQVAKGFKRDIHWQKLSFSLDEPPAVAPEREAMEAEVEEQGGRAYLTRFPNPEQQAAARELLAWVAGAVAKTSETDQATFEAIQAQVAGEANTVGEALGIGEEAGRKRKWQLTRSLIRVAAEEPNPDLLFKLGGREKGEAILALQPTPEDAEHRIDEVLRYRAGLLSPVESIAFEKHVAECAGCRWSLRMQKTVDEAVEAFLFVPLPFDVEKFLRERPAARPGRSAWKRAAATAALALVAILAVAWWLRGERTQMPKLAAPVEPRRMIPVRAKDELLMAPEPTPPAGGGVRSNGAKR